MTSYKEALQESAAALAAQTPEMFSKSFTQTELVNSGIETLSRFDQDMARPCNPSCRAQNNPIRWKNSLPPPRRKKPHKRPC